MARTNFTARNTQPSTKSIGNVIYLPCSDREPVQNARHYGRYPRGVASFNGYRRHIGWVRVGDIAVVVTDTYPGLGGLRVKITRKEDKEREMPYTNKTCFWYNCEVLNGKKVRWANGEWGDTVNLPECCLLPVAAISA